MIGTLPSGTLVPGSLTDGSVPSGLAQYLAMLNPEATVTEADKKKARAQGLLAFGSAMLQAAGPQPKGTMNFGKGLGLGAQAAQDAYNQQINTSFRQNLTSEQQRLAQMNNAIGAWQRDNSQATADERNEIARERNKLIEEGTGQDPALVREYKFYEERELAAGRTPVSFQDYIEQIKQAESITRITDADGNEILIDRFGRQIGQIEGMKSDPALERETAAQARRDALLEGNATEREYRNGLRSSGQALEGALPRLYRLREQVKNGPETGMASDIQKVFDAEYQALQAIYTQAGLNDLATMKERGVTFGALSEGEIGIVFSGSPQLTNKKQANLEIVDNQIAALEKTYQQIEGRLSDPTPFTNQELMGLDKLRPQQATPSKTAVNPNTGERIGLIDGEWVPLD